MAGKTSEGVGFSDFEKAAMKERAAELKKKASAEKDLEGLLEKIAEMPPAERAMAEKIHEIVLDVAPDLRAKTWYGMPSWAREGKSLVFFQPATKFDSRYSTLGFQDNANLDEGSMWAASYALTAIGPAEEARIRELIIRAVS